MKLRLIACGVFLASALAAFAQKPAAPQVAAATPAELQQVLAKMNHASAGFKSAQADFQFDYYTKAVDEHDIQKGQISFRRSGKDVDVSINITSPVVKQVIYKDGKISFYQPKIDQVTVKEVGKNKSDVEAVLNLGFGGSGDELMKSFDVVMEGWETIDGVKTAKLQLTGKSADLKKLFTRAVLWIDTERDVPLQQQFFETTGDYRLNHYPSSSIKLNTKLSDDIFRLKTTGKTQFVRPQ